MRIRRSIPLPTSTGSPSSPARRRHAFPAPRSRRCALRRRPRRSSRASPSRRSPAPAPGSWSSPASPPPPGWRTGASPMRTEMLALACALSAGGAVLTGCGRAAADRADQQLVARVNGVEISARQLGPRTASVAQAVEKVIDRELLVQKAMDAGLERDPQVAAQIDNARREVLAQAYLERAARAAAKPSREEVRAFYAENPGLFAERRIYRTREISVSANADMVDALRSHAATTRDIDELAAWLRARGTSAVVVNETQPAEQRPLAFLPVLSRMKPGELAVV